MSADDEKIIVRMKMEGWRGMWKERVVSGSCWYDA